MEFLGPRSDVRERILRDATVMVHPTHVEGLPGVIIEAIAAGVPVVASDIPPNRGVARWLSGITLAPLEASADTWARAVVAAVQEATQDRTSTSRLVKSFHASPFSMTVHVEKMLGLWGIEKLPT